MTAPLAHIKILDLTRVLAGPTATQILGDLGADVVKIEQPGAGDDTRRWGPPFLKDAQGRETSESAYYLSTNRNKRSVTIDISSVEGQALIDRMAAQSDILIHNFRPGTLERYGLGFETMAERHPRLIYAAISGFGHNGPLSSLPGYDLLAQAMGGLMAHTGEPGAPPVKAGVALSDVMTGLYAVIGVLAALQARDKTGRGQMIDLALLDVTMAGMVNLAQSYLTSGVNPARHGNAHASIVPYQMFETSDRPIVVAVGNDAQFARFAAMLSRDEWASDPRFASNPARVAHREALIPAIQAVLSSADSRHWLCLLKAADIPAGPVNTIGEALEAEHSAARNMIFKTGHTFQDDVRLVGNPLHMSGHRIECRLPPPTLGEHTREILAGRLGLSEREIDDLEKRGVI